MAEFWFNGIRVLVVESWEVWVGVSGKGFSAIFRL